MSQPCASYVFGDRVQSWRCTRRGVVERNGKWWCSQHDPDAVKARQGAADAKRKAEDVANEAVKDAMQALADRLGCGQPYYRIGLRAGTSGYRHALIVTRDEVEALLTRLERAEGDPT